MFLHYLKIVWRNLLKYKTQSVISIVGLAIGFTAFSFTLSWIRYERGFDSHIKDVDRVYKVLKVDEKREGGVGFSLPAPMKEFLETFPEVEAATALQIAEGKHPTSLVNGYMMSTDTSFFKVFYPEVSINYPSEFPEDKRYFILSDDAARSVGLDYSDVGRDVKNDIDEPPYKFTREFTLLGIVPGASDARTNVPFDVMTVGSVELDGDCPWCYFAGRVYIRVHENANVEALAAKLDSINIEGSLQGVMSYILVPLRESRYLYPEDEANIRYHHLRVFSYVSLLVIACALFNYLMLFINRIKIRGRELALRKVNGASNWELIGLLLVELGVILLSSLFIGMVLSELLYTGFIKLSGIEASRMCHFMEMALYGLILFCIFLSGAFVLLYYFTRKSVGEILRPEIKSSQGVKNRFTKTSLFIQLLIGILLIFSTFLFLYQYEKLNSTEIGFNRFNINTLQSHAELTKNEIRKIAGVEEVVFFHGQFLPRTMRSSFIHETEAGKTVDAEIIEFHQPDFVDFFGMKIVEGRNVHDGELDACLINETAKRELDFTEPMGKIVAGKRVVGVIADMYIDAPSLPVLPTLYRLREYLRYEAARLNRETGQYEPLLESITDNSGFFTFAYKYLPGSRESTEQAIRELAATVEGREFRFTNIEEVYEQYTTSERNLLVLLSVMTGVAILIAVFGIYSMITLSCNQRRKEIAIRKVNGAKAGEIFSLFFREYFAVTLLSCVVAFPIGVYIMQRWLEQYTRRVSMEWWLFVGIFILVTLIVLASIFSRVNRAARENPAEVVKSE